jgi:DNA polymerase-3 subunit epsilon
MANATSWLDKSFVVLDLATTGTDPDTARIVQLALTIASPQGLVVDELTMLVRPRVPIPPTATAVHGVSDEDVMAHGRPVVAALASLRDRLRPLVRRGCPVVAFNGSDDLTVLDRELRREGFGSTEQALGRELKLIDPLVIDRHFDRYRNGKRTLTVLAEQYGVPLSEDDAHTALGDVRATLGVLRALVRRFPVLATMTTEDLHAVQADAQAAWAANVQNYLRRKGDTDTIIDHRFGARPPIDADPDRPITALVNEELRV